MSDRGDIAIVTALILLSILLSSALILGFILVKQVKLAGSVVSSERAIYAANSGLEESLYRFSRQFALEVDLENEIEYEGRTATYQAQGFVQDPNTGRLCLTSLGRFTDEQRRLGLRTDSCPDQS